MMEGTGLNGWSATGHLPKSLVMQRKIEFKQIMYDINNQPGINKIQDNTQPILLGYLKDNFETGKEEFRKPTAEEQKQFNEEHNIPETQA